MILQIVKKQALILLRNRMELLLLFGLPIILITILSSALSTWMESGEIEINLKVALIEQNNEEDEINQFISEFENSGIPPEAVEKMKETASVIAPVTLIKDAFRSAEVNEMVELVRIDPSEKEAALDDDSYSAVIEIPENFTYDTLKSVMLNEQNKAEMKIYQNEEQEIGANIINQLLSVIQEQLTFGTFLAENGIDPNVTGVEDSEMPGAAAIVDTKESVSSKGYYTIGMAVMNVLFMATAIGSISFKEKTSHVFDRIVLANMSRWIYFIGVLLTGMLFALVQLMIVFGFAWIAFDVDWPSVGSFILVTLAISLAVGGLAVLLTALSYRVNSEMIISFFSSIIVTFMAVLGGSFFPIGESSSVIAFLGNLTPNGAGMSAYLALLRGDGLLDISQYIIYIFLFALVAIIIGELSFPKKGVS
ncbi:ABC transporter permease [Oceanobacillus piezotolerans]|uniref:ABC transporter permease n=1 Tax=Oceanobacillus piezotolerans TaxID=2448030 RepID=A0A498DHH8_9BACI|nr:ABC transporter permease [Oceanobacillus piezotolerans]RLL44945.1 ABC transporter permease [Oceanobacillus piezotolerans]